MLVVCCCHPKNVFFLLNGNKSSTVVVYLLVNIYFSPSKLYGSSKAWPKINCSQMKSPNFVSPSADSSSKIGRHFSNKAVLKLKLAKNAFYKKGAPKLIFFNEKKN